MDEPDLNPPAISTPEVISAAPAEPAAVPCRPWGPWATIGWSLLCVALFLVVQVAVLVAYVLLNLGGETPPEQLAEQAGTDGLFMALATCATMLVCTSFLALIVYLRGCPLVWYFGLRWVEFATAGKAVVALLAFIAVTDGLTYLLGRPIVPEFMDKVYATAGFLPLLVFALVVAAPVFEELFFRGFMHRGLAAGRLGNTGAVVVTALCWAVIHLQYDWYGIATIFLMGLLLGAVRVRTGSTALTILLHGIANFIATLEVIVKVEFWGG
jgi:membrane protease YdiL (CAAX protease family)